MKKCLIALAVLILVAAAIVLVPASRKIDTVLEATEYSFSDPTVAVSHTVTVKGCDTRNLLGRGRYEGVFSTDGWELSAAGWKLLARFPAPDDYWNAYGVDSFSQALSTNVFSILPDRNWTSFVALLQDVADQPDGTRTASFDPKNAHFLVSGNLPRDEAIVLAQRLSKRTSLEPLFTIP